MDPTIKDFESAIAELETIVKTLEDGAEMLAARLRHCLTVAEVAASIGVASTQDGDLEHAWRRADLAMYEEKRGRATVGAR